MAADALEKSVLESKDKEQLVAIATALGIKAGPRAKKEDIITKILDTVGGPGEAEAPAEKPKRGPGRPPKARPAEDATSVETSDGESSADKKAPAPAAAPAVILGPDGEPLAEWEAELVRQGVSTVADLTGGESAPSGEQRQPRDGNRDGNRDRNRDRNGDRNGNGQRDGNRDSNNRDGNRDRFEGEGRNRRRRRRGKGGRDEGPQGEDRDGNYDQGGYQGGEPVVQESVPVEGYLDLRDEGYGFLRVRGFLPSRDDAYISVKQTRQYGLRKGDHVTGIARTAGRNEKNPALLEINTVNGGSPDKAKDRPRFEDLTALFPDEKLRLESPLDPGNMTARIIDLISPIGKGQRGIIVSPPKAGKTTIMKEIATAIERNNPEVQLMVLLIDERPEEVTDMRRTVRGEVISSTFDRPSEEHTHVAELAIEKAKRQVEMGRDVVVILDGITRLSRAYNLAAPASGRILSGGIDAGALYPPKKFFGAARNVEEGGSLTILATALVETNSRMDEAIFEEFKGTGNMELRLDRRLAEKRIYPAIDVDGSSTRHEELLFDRKQLQMVWKLRRVLSGLASDGNPAPGLELLIDRLKQFKNNDDFLSEIGKTPTM
ncbi:MAG: transcription termination factor Rho [Ilumatobacteraceae bacterium]|nr:transcription termination factor Rho [Ilumatobacteraceae bacterium]